MYRFVLLAFTFALTAPAQQLPTSSLQVHDGLVSFTYVPPRAAPALTGAPYSADELQEYLPPGSDAPPRAAIIGHFARDTKGRTRSTRAYKAANYWLTEIFDPVAGVAILLDEDARVAHRMTVQPAPPIPPRPGIARQSLGTEWIEGVAAEGTRLSSGPLTLETWTSPELKLDLVTRSSNGYTTRLINLSRTEPDPAVFQIPADYRVIDENAPFAMTVKIR